MGAFAQLLVEEGHEVFCIDRDVDVVAATTERLGTRLHVAGQVESLPYLSCHFDVVTSSQNLHKFAPGLALTEIARVLRPGGHLAVAYNTRDDTVPWVRRLTALLQQNDPEAMRGDYGIESLGDVTDSPYFTDLVRRELPQLGADHPQGSRLHGRAPPEHDPARSDPSTGAAGRGRRAVRLDRPTTGAAAAAVPGIVLAR